MWALGLIGCTDPFDIESDENLMSQVPLWNVEDFVKHAKLRNGKQISNYLDTVELWHYRSNEWLRDQELGDGTPHFGLDTTIGSIKYSAQNAYKTGRVPKLIDGDFPALGKAFRDLSTSEWNHVNSTIVARLRTLHWLCGKAPDDVWDLIFKDDPIPIPIAVRKEGQWSNS